MPYVNIKITKEGGPDGSGATAEQKAELIAGVTKLLSDTLQKDPATTFVVIDEVPLDSWGIAGKPVTEYRARKN
ncbi:MAG: 4-oxalocrotonate tautomerase family protein [Kangiellaceae bacterium]|nr:4-oxalocrotonate tautomerase family protein [Kangiellaceae bacterium]